ncbi:V-type proton ATPase subunit e-like [Physella acuta]|uniref:V-type proton ATPase subunit e-like n=1 Tax=Physella acuta TaxID=109671 RepID=UPI0027DB0EBC|nr:V-type proton ATPase subunit e-like [Physella acuta]
MSDTGLALGVISAIWAFIGIILPIIIHFVMAKSPNRGIVQICLILTAVCCFIFWIVTYIAQLNPLIGPQLKLGVIKMMLLEW